MYIIECEKQMSFSICVLRIQIKTPILSVEWIHPKKRFFLLPYYALGSTALLAYDEGDDGGWLEGEME